MIPVRAPTSIPFDLANPGTRKVDGGVVMPQYAVPKLNLRRVCNNGVKAMAFEKLLEEQEFGIQALLHWVCVDDGNGLQRAFATR